MSESVAGYQAPHEPPRPPQIASSADVDHSAVIEPGTVIWHLAQVREYARLGPGCILGRGAYVGPGVILGKNCKVHNYALIYEPALLEDGVFVGPAAVFTNAVFPRAINIDGTRRVAPDWELVGVTVRKGASIGANAVCVAPVKIGRWAMVAAGAVVTKDVPDHALVAGVPARRIGWVGRSGIVLRACGWERFVCPATGELYVEAHGILSLAANDVTSPPLPVPFPEGGMVAT